MFHSTLKTLIRRTLVTLSFLLVAGLALRWLNHRAFTGTVAFAQTETSPAETNQDDNWDARFNLPGIEGEVYAVAVSGNDVYVAGRFTTAGGVRVNNIAKWNGSAWSALGNGISGEPARGVPAYAYALAVSGSEVYVGGSFTTAGEIAANNIAKWNGTSWSALGAGLGTASPLPNIGAVVIALGLNGNDLYVGGFFNTAGGVNTNGLAKWNGTSWSGFNLPFFLVGVQDAPPTVRAITVSGNDIYIGGYFVGINGVPANSLAKWNGSVWTGLNGLSAPDFNPFFNPVVSAIGVSGADVFVSGDFNQAGTVSVSGSARWNNGNWSALTGARTLGARRSPIMAIGTDIYLCEEVARSGESVTGNLVKWTGSDWATVAPGLKGITNLSVSALAAQGTRLFAVGNFNAAGNVAVSKVAQWNGSDWSALGTGLGVNDRVNALVPAGSELIVGGRFTATGNSQFKRLAKLNGLAWSAISNDIPFAEVYQVAVRGEEIFVVSQAPQFSSTNLYRWNGSSWSSLSRIVESIVINGSDLYAITFSNLGKAVSKWDGSNWVDIAQAVAARTLAVNGKDLYVGGEFTSIGGVNANRIAKWDGTSWTALGSGLGHSLSGTPLTFISSIVVQGGAVYVGGRFTTAGGISANSVARWNGSTWSALGSALGDGVSVVDPFFNEFTSEVTAMTLRDNELFVSGTFTRAGDVPANGIARWNGTTWSALGSGIGGFSIAPENASPTRRVNALAISQNFLYAGGTFTTAGSKPSPFLARYALGNPSPNTRPSIVAMSPITRQQGSAGSSATIATVADGETAAGNLRIVATTIPAGLTLTELGNTNGAITARVGAPCVVPPGLYTIVLEVTDANEATATAQLNVTVTANTPPVLGAYPATLGLSASGGFTATAVPPTDNGTITNFTATSATFTGTLSANPTTGVVTISNARPVGTHTITIRATDSCGATSSTTIALTVTKVVSGAPLLLALAPAIAGRNITLLANYVTPEGASVAPTGSLTFFDGTTALSTVPLSLSPSDRMLSIASLTTTNLARGPHRLTVTHAGDENYNASVSQVLVLDVAGALATVSAANYRAEALAPGQIIAAFGTELANTTASATTVPLPTTLGGVSVKVRDYAGDIERLAPLFYVSPTQINFQLPPETFAGNELVGGRSTITITNGSSVSISVVAVEPVAPGLFALNATGRGLAAAQVLRVLANGAQRYEEIARFNPVANQWEAIPIDLSNAAEQVFLVLYGTGLRGRSALSRVTSTIGGTAVETLYAGAQGNLAGLDQLNLRLPRSLAGRGNVDIALTVNGKTANVVQVNLK